MTPWRFHSGSRSFLRALEGMMWGVGGRLCTGGTYGFVSYHIIYSVPDGQHRTLTAVLVTDSKVM